MYNRFVNMEYNNKEHSSLGISPKERFMRDYEGIIRKSDEELEECFLHRETRLVRNDATITFMGNLYEVPQEFIKKTIAIKYKPSEFEELYVYNDKNERVCSIKPIDKVSNRNMKRAKNESLYRKEEDLNV